jgi:hypothetical protein
MEVLGVSSVHGTCSNVSYQYVREIKSACQYAVQRVVVFRNRIHLSVYRSAKPAFYVITRCVSHLKHIKLCNNVPNVIEWCL